MLDPVQIELRNGRGEKFVVQQEQFQEPEFLCRRARRRRLRHHNEFVCVALGHSRRPDFLELHANGVNADSETLCRFLRVSVRKHSVVGFCQSLAHLTQDLLTTTVSPDVVLGAQEL